MKKQENSTIDLSWARFSGRQITTSVKKSEQLTKKSKQELLKLWNSKKISAEEFLFKLDNLDPTGLIVAPMKTVSDWVETLQLLPANKEIKKAADDAMLFVTQKKNEIFADKELADILGQITENDVSLEYQKILNDWKDYYLYQGFFAGKNAYKKVATLRNKIKQNEILFTTNISNYNKEILCSKEELVGISDDKLQLFKKVIKGKKEYYSIGTSYPEYNLVLAYAENGETRRKVHENFRQRGGVKNLALLNKLQDYCAELSGILGFDNFAEVTTSQNLIGNVKKLNTFIASLKKGIAPIAKNEIKETVTFAKSELAKIGEKRSVEVWDQLYYERLLKEQKFNLDIEANKEYFPLDHVLATFFELVKVNFGVSVTETSQKLWHKDVLFYKLVDLKTKQVLGYWALDLFPRAGKYSHMAAGNAVMSRKVDGVRQPAFSVMFGNFNPATKTKPALLSTDELETLLHEFGHMCHDLFTQVNFISHAGTNTTLDFSEVPSQFFEEFLSTSELLKSFSKHYKTGKKLPNDIADRVINSRNWHLGLVIWTQLAQTELDLSLHLKKERDILKLWREIRKNYGLMTEPDSFMYPANFGHLSSMYAAGYWSYMVSLVYSIDCWNKIIESGNISKQELLRFKKEILEVGSSRPELDSLKSFLKREPKADALIVYIKNS